MTASGATLGLIAGGGAFPREVVRAARARGDRVVAVGFVGETDADLGRGIDVFERIHLGQLERLLSVLRDGGVRRAVMVGKVWKTRVYEDPASLQADARALALLASLVDRQDHSILAAIADVLAEEGIELLAQAEAVPELFAGVGPVGGRALSDRERNDVAYGWPIAKAVAELEIGQTVVFKDRSVLAVEAVEGTDAAIARGGALAGDGAVVVKLARKDQDPRFDMPTIGPETLESLVRAKASALVFEAGRTAVLDREALAGEADAHQIAVVGVVGGEV